LPLINFNLIIRNRTTIHIFSPFFCLDTKETKNQGCKTRTKKGLLCLKCLKLTSANAYVQTPNIFTYSFTLFLNVHVSLCLSMGDVGGDRIADNRLILNYEFVNY